MPYTPRGVAQALELIKEINQLQGFWPPEVVREDHEIDEDWNGNPAIHFTIVLRDQAATRERLGDVTSRVRSFVVSEVDPRGRWDLIPYFRFISQSEDEETRQGAMQ